MYRVKDVMTKDILTISENATAGETINLFVKHNISGAPVVNDKGCLVGIISEVELLSRIFNPDAKHQRISDIMTKKVIAVQPTTLLSDVAIALVTKRIRRVPVVEDGQVVGIVSRKDLMRYIDQSGEKLDAFLEQVRTRT